MSLSIADRWIWDFWLAIDGPDFHIYFLQAPRSIGDPNQRHWHATIGHAVSGDLKNWEILPDALAPSSTAGVWDDYTTWTGSIIHHAGLWYMFYTGGCREEKGLVQRIGLATSKDLIAWKKYEGNPILEADPRIYEVLDLNVWYEQAWRDPWVMKHPEEEAFYAFITARVNHGPGKERGVIALARSTDLLNWQVKAPVTNPGDYGHLEIPQVVQVNQQNYLLFSTTYELASKARRQNAVSPLVTGTHYLASDNLLGPYTKITDKFLVGDAYGSRYGGKLVPAGIDAWALLTMRYFDAAGNFIGELADPIPIRFGNDGRIQLDSN